MWIHRLSEGNQNEKSNKQENLIGLFAEKTMPASDNFTDWKQKAK